MGMFALLQFRENFFEINWSFEKKNYCFFEVNFSKTFLFRAIIIAFNFFLVSDQKISTGLSEQFYMCSKQHFEETCVFEKKISLCWSFRHFAEKTAKISKKISQQGCKKSFPNVQRDMLKETDIFWREMFSFSFNSGIWVKIFTSLGKACKQVYQNCKIPVQKNTLKIIFEKKYKYCFRFISQNGWKVFDFGEKTLARLSKLGVRSNILRKIASFCSKTYILIFSRVWAGYFSNLENCCSSFVKKVLYMSRGTFWKKVFLICWTPIFLAGLRAKNYCFSGIHCLHEIQNRILPINREVHGLWLFFQTWTNITKTGTKFAIFVKKRTHPEDDTTPIKLTLEENDSAAG